MVLRRASVSTLYTFIPLCQKLDPPNDCVGIFREKEAVTRVFIDVLRALSPPMCGSRRQVEGTTAPTPPPRPAPFCNSGVLRPGIARGMRGAMVIRAVLPRCAPSRQCSGRVYGHTTTVRPWITSSTPSLRRCRVARAHRLWSYDHVNA